MKDIFLIVSSLGTDRAGETLHYEVSVGGSTIAGDFAGKLTSGEYRKHIGQAPDDVHPVLVTPDARLRLVVLPEEG